MVIRYLWMSMHIACPTVVYLSSGSVWFYGIFNSRSPVNFVQSLYHRRAYFSLHHAAVGMLRGSGEDFDFGGKLDPERKPTISEERSKVPTIVPRSRSRSRRVATKATGGISSPS